MGTNGYNTKNTQKSNFLSVFLPKQDFFDSIDWIDTHRSELREKYQGKWIAVFNRKIVASGKKIRNVRKKAMTITNKALDETPIVYIEDSHCIYIY